MSGRMEGQIVVFTGAAGELGRPAVLQLASEGAVVVPADIKPAVEETWSEVHRRYPENRGFASITDVASGEAVNRMIDQVVERLGRLDLMVNNAGFNQNLTPVTDITDELFDHIINVNLRGVFNGCRAAARVMREQRSGNMVNTGSWYGKRGFRGFSVYCASKAAVIRFTESVAMEMAPYGVRVNSICPGHMATEMHYAASRDEAKLRGITFEEMDRKTKASIPLGQQGTPEQYADVIMFLASKESSYITGQAINLNGGLLFN